MYTLGLRIIYKTSYIPALEGSVAFTVSIDGEYNAVINQRIPYPHVITNIGNGYIQQRNEFVCPESGTYVFYATLISKGERLRNTTLLENNGERPQAELHIFQ